MAYYPQVLTQFRPPIETTNVVYDYLWDNHAELYALYSGVIGEHSDEGYVHNTTQTAVWRFISRGGHDYGSTTGVKVKLTILASGTTSGGNVYLTNTTNSGAVAVNGAMAIYTVTVLPGQANETWTIDLEALTSSTITVYAWSAEWVGVDGTTAFASGWRQGDALWKTNDSAIHTEGMGRLIKGPSAIATDRPICVFSHFAPIGAYVFAKTAGEKEGIWGENDLAYQTTVGRGLIPRCDTRPRTYTVDWVMSSTGPADGKILIGGKEIIVNTSDAWGTATFELTQGDHEIRAALTPLATYKAYFQCVQVWRGV